MFNPIQFRINLNVNVYVCYTRGLSEMVPIIYLWEQQYYDEVIYEIF